MKKIILSSLLLTGLIQAKEIVKEDLHACKVCHGRKFEKKALGKSKKVSEMSYSEIKSALVGYKKRTYGGNLKGIMERQVYNLKSIKEASKEIYSINHELDGSEF